MEAGAAAQSACDLGGGSAGGDADGFVLANELCCCQRDALFFLREAFFADVEGSVEPEWFIDGLICKHGAPVGAVHQASTLKAHQVASYACRRGGEQLGQLFDGGFAVAQQEPEDLFCTFVGLR